MDLAELFRATLAGPEHILLSKELDIAKHYLDIEQIRFGERLSIVWKVPDEIPPVTVPSLSIQPLVENAIRHGVELRSEVSQIVVEVRQTSETIVVEVSNPCRLTRRQRARHQVGLAAVRARLHDLDSRMGLQTTTQGNQFLATLHAPLAEIPSR